MKLVNNAPLWRMFRDKHELLQLYVIIDAKG